jgi:hypothetical protein
MIFGRHLAARVLSHWCIVVARFAESAKAKKTPSFV